jgi:hypothetical protein
VNPVAPGRPRAPRPKGWLPDKAENLDHRGLRYAQTIRANTFLGKQLDTPDHMPFRGGRLYQIGGTCAAYSLKRAVYMSHRMLTGDPDPAMLSAAYAYKMAQYEENRLRKDPNFILREDGCFAALLMRAAQRIGFIREDHHPDVEANSITRPPPAKLDRLAYDQRSLDWTFISETGFDRVKAVASAMRSGWTILAPRYVDVAYENYHGQGVIDDVDENAITGGHMQVVLTVATDGTKIREDNWWDDWGDAQGTGWVSAKLFGSSIYKGIYAVRYAPGFSG